MESENFDEYIPQYIVFVKNTADIVHALEYCKYHGLTFSVRSGRHRYEEFSVDSKIAIDASELKENLLTQRAVLLFWVLGTD